MPCGSPGTDCRPGYIQKLAADQVEEYDFRIGPERP
jgi:hypothetical protein